MLFWQLGLRSKSQLFKSYYSVIYCISSIHEFTLQQFYKCLWLFRCSNPYNRRPPSRRGDRGSSRGDVRSRLGAVPDRAAGTQGNKSDWYKVVVGIKIFWVQLHNYMYIPVNVLNLPYFSCRKSYFEIGP